MVSRGWIYGMKDSWKFLFWGLISVLLAPNLSAQDLRDDQFLAKAEPGFVALHSLDYDQAGRVFRSMQKSFPDHPAPPLYLAATVWLQEMFRRQELEMSRFAWPGHFIDKQSSVMPAEQKHEFFRYLNLSETLCRRILASEAKHRDAAYYLSGNYAIRGVFLFTIEGQAKEAFNHGKTAYGLGKEILARDPTYHDAYLGTGIYEYMVGSFPWYIKWLVAVMGYRGNKEKGFQYLDTAVQQGDNVTVEAAIAYNIILMREERWAEALAYAEQLHRQFPRNYLFHLNVANHYYALGRYEQAAEVYREVLKRTIAEAPNYDRMPDRQRGSTLIRLGNIYDRLGRREEAIEQYQAVLRHSDNAALHRHAQKYLKQPFE